MEPLRVSLETYGSENVRAIARRLDLPEVEQGVSKAQLVNLLVEAIPERVKGAGGDLFTAAESAVLAILLEHGGAAPPSQVVDPMVLSGLVRLENTSDLDSAAPLFDDVLHALLLQGVIVNLTPPTGRSRRRDFTPLQEVAIPPEVVRVLPQGELALPSPNPQSFGCAPPPRQVGEDPVHFLRRLLFFWGELWREPGRALKSGGLYKRDLRRLVQSLGETLESVGEEPMRDLVALLMYLDLIMEVDGEIFAEHQASLWQKEVPAVLREVMDVLPFVAPSIDLPDMPSNVLSYGYGEIDFRSLDSLYEQTLDLLETLADGEWFSFPLFLSLLNRGRDGAFLFARSNIKALHERVSWYGWSNESVASRRQRLEQYLQRAERVVVTQILRYLKEHGIVTLGYEEDGEKITALRLTDLARAALTGSSYEGDTSSDGQVVLQPDFQLLAMGPVSLKTLASLERLAVREDVQPSTVTYRLTRDSVYGALQSGETVHGILELLRSHSLMPLPQNVERSLNEWGAKHERIVVRRDVLVLQVDTPDLLETLVQEESLADIVHPLSDCAAWVYPADVPRLERRLWALEYLPTASRSPAEDLPESVEWEASSGQLLPKDALPSFYVTGTLQRFAEQEDGAWTLTPEAVRAAVSAGLSIPEVLERLEEMIGGPLSRQWEQRLKAWGGHYGDAQTARVRLIRLESAEALRELRESDRRFKRWLKPLDGDLASVAVVDVEDWDDVRARLEEWGITVTESAWW